MLIYISLSNKITKNVHLYTNIKLVKMRIVNSIYQFIKMIDFRFLIYGNLRVIIIKR